MNRNLLNSDQLLKIRQEVDRIFLSGSSLAYARLAFVVAILLVFMYFGRVGFEDIDMPALLESWRAQYPVLNAIPNLILKIWAFFFSGRNFRYLFLPLATLIGAIFFGARYVQDTYHLPRFRQAFYYMISALFGIRYPRVTAAEGKLQVQKDEINLVQVIGGPGLLHVKPGNVVLLEKLQGPGRICEAGIHYLNQLEKVKEVVSLEDQHGFIEEVRARTKDGIPVRVLGVNFRYRLRAGRKAGDFTERTPENPYPFSRKAFLDMAYRRVTTLDEGVTPWHVAVTRAVEGAIGEYINTHQLDQLTAPTHLEDDPRTQILDRVNSKRTREILHSLGAELLWVGIGHFDIEQKVKDQRLDTWEAKWVGDAKLIEAYGEAQRIIYQEIGRAEGQAELLMGIIHALDKVSLQGDSVQKIRNIILLRTAQILEALSDREKPELPRKLPPPETVTRKRRRVKRT